MTLLLILIGLVLLWLFAFLWSLERGAEPVQAPGAIPRHHPMRPFLLASTTLTPVLFFRERR